MSQFSRRSLLAVGATLLLGGVARAQNYPSRPVKIVVPFPAGGSNDIVARIVAQKLTERCGHPFLVENRGGAGGNLGAEAVATSDPDGTTLLLTAPPPLVASNKHLGPSESTSQRQSYTVPFTLAPNTTYYWKVVSKTAASKTASGPVWYFRTGS